MIAQGVLSTRPFVRKPISIEVPKADLATLSLGRTMALMERYPEFAQVSLSL
jgi:hypothetical protein